MRRRLARGCKHYFAFQAGTIRCLCLASMAINPETPLYVRLSRRCSRAGKPAAAVVLSDQSSSGTQAPIECQRRNHRLSGGRPHASANSHRAAIAGFERLKP